MSDSATVVEPRPTDLRLFLALWLVLAFFTDPLIDTVTNRYFWPAMAMVNESRFEIDSYVGSPPVGDICPREGHWYSVVAPGTSLLLAPGVAVMQQLYPKFPAKWFSSVPDRFLFLCQLLLVPLLLAPGGALAGVLMRRFLVDRGHPARLATLAAVCLPLGTHAFYYLSRTYAHGWALALILAGWSAAWLARESGSKAAAFRAGFLLLGAYLFDYSALWVLLMAALAVRIRRWPAFLAGTLLPLAGLMLYQWLAHGHPLRTGYQYFPGGTPDVIPFSREWFGAYEWKDLREAAWGLTFGLRGLFYVVPLAWGLPWVLSRRADSTARWGAAVFLLSFAFNMTLRHGLWVGGTCWGPRHLVLTLPFLFMAVMPACSRLSHYGMVALATLSVLINWVGVQFGAGFSVVEHLAYFGLSGPTSPLFRWLSFHRETVLVAEHLANVPPNVSGHYWAFTQLSPVGAYLLLAILVGLVLYQPRDNR